MPVVYAGPICPGGGWGRGRSGDRRAAGEGGHGGGSTASMHGPTLGVFSIPHLKRRSASKWGRESPPHLARDPWWVRDPHELVHPNGECCISIIHRMIHKTPGFYGPSGGDKADSRSWDPDYLGSYKRWITCQSELLGGHLRTPHERGRDGKGSSFIFPRNGPLAWSICAFSWGAEEFESFFGCGWIVGL